MTKQQRVGTPGPNPRTFRCPTGELLEVPGDWDLLPPGDATLTRRVKAGGAFWLMQEKRGRKLFSRGMWAPKSTIEAARAQLEQEREDPSYQQRLEKDRARRAVKEEAYAQSFALEVFKFLDFAPRYHDVARSLAIKIAEHATPVGSNTVARTQRISVEERAQAATIAWLRHQTTGYDDMKIPRIKGMRREVRRMLAQRSQKLLGKYRRGDADAYVDCPLARALVS